MDIKKTEEKLESPTICHLCKKAIERGEVAIVLEANYGCRKRKYPYHQKCYGK